MIDTKSRLRIGVLMLALGASLAGPAAIAAPAEARRTGPTLATAD